MKNMLLRDVLNMILWDKRKILSEYELIYHHRGASSDSKRIKCDQIIKVSSMFFTYKEEEAVKIPLHRVLQVRNRKNGKTIWKKKV